MEQSKEARTRHGRATFEHDHATYRCHINTHFVQISKESKAPIRKPPYFPITHKFQNLSHLPRHRVSQLWMLFQIPKFFLSSQNLFIFPKLFNQFQHLSLFPIHSFQNTIPLYINHPFIFFTLNSLIHLPLQSLKHNLFYFPFSLYFYHLFLHFLSHPKLWIQYTMERESRRKLVTQRRLRWRGGSSSNPSQ